MERIESGPENPHLKHLKEEIAASRDAIKDELFRTRGDGRDGNDWLACFATRLQTLENILFFAYVDETIPNDKRQKLRENLDSLMDVYRSLRREYPNSKKNLTEDLPSENIKEDLMNKLDILKGAE